jgi:hypothetical protein
MPRRPGPLDADLGDVFTVAAALEAGITPARLRSRDLERPFHGVRRRGRPMPADASTVGAAEHSRRGRAIVLSDAAACLAVAPPMPSSPGGRPRWPGIFRAIPATSCAWVSWLLTVRRGVRACAA